jgi:G3E family GTPase
MTDQPIKFFMIGGFLGAGKTTTIARLARHLIDNGLKVGLVTNDQAYDLVDTQSLRSQGFDVGEVPGACFCCKFDDLISTVRGLCAHDRPDVIIAEPVGSCTDLVATVLEPMCGLYGDDFQPGRYAVLLKPEHGLKILQRDEVGFSEQAAYIFLKQLEEADLIVINKVDKLAPDVVAELQLLVKDHFPSKRCLPFSAKTGTGFESLVAELSAPLEERTLMDVDYDVYAEGEAELGWLNATVRFTADQRKRLDQLALEIVANIQEQLDAAGTEVAHLKVLASAGDSNAAIANLVGTEATVDLSIASEVAAEQVELTINARVATGPDKLARMVQVAIERVAEAHGATTDIVSLQKLSPGRPVPTHRVTS